jgi:hypothetical protein
MKIKVSWTEVKTSVVNREATIDTDQYDNLRDLSYETIQKTVEEDLLFIGEDNIEEFMKSKDEEESPSSTVVYSKMKVEKVKS